MNIFFLSIANLKCTPSDRQMYPRGTHVPQVGNPCYDILHAQLVYKFNGSKMRFRKIYAARRY